MVHVNIMTISYEFASDIWSQPVDERKAEELSHLLFPNRTKDVYSQSMRGLAGYHPKPEKPEETKCLICSKLTYCKALNSFYIQEKYYPVYVEGNPGTCGIIEDLAKRVQLEVFGNGKTFRDSPLCRDVVMQYLCLFWGSDNQMYTNLCAWNEKTDVPDPSQHILAPKPPCRSFCVQVADICANDPNFVDLCNNIACPPKEDECFPGNDLN